MVKLNRLKPAWLKLTYFQIFSNNYITFTVLPQQVQVIYECFINKCPISVFFEVLNRKQLYCFVFCELRLYHRDTYRID